MSDTNTNNFSNKQTIKKDSSLLQLENKINNAGNSQNIINNKFVFKPEIKKVESRFLSKERLDFLEKFKCSTNELISNPNKRTYANIEDLISNGKNENESNNNNINNDTSQYVKMNLKLGVLDIIPNNNNNFNCNESVSTMITSSDNCNNVNALKNMNLRNNETSKFNNFMYNNENNANNSNLNSNLGLNLREDQEFYDNNDIRYKLNEEDQLNMINNDRLLNLLADENSDEEEEDEDEEMM